jgi:hypothetical protein
MHKRCNHTSEAPTFHNLQRERTLLHRFTTKFDVHCIGTGCIHIHTYIHSCIHTSHQHAKTNKTKHTNILHTYTHIHSFIHRQQTHTYIHTNKHTYIHTHTHTNRHIHSIRKQTLTTQHMHCHRVTYSVVV